MENSNKIIEIELSKKKLLAFYNIVYSQPMTPYHGAVDLKMDILKPDSTKEKLPLVLYITGGGFMSSPKENYLQQRISIAEAGYIVASIEYRVIPKGKFPDALVDVKSAIRYLKSHSDKYGIDKNKIIVMGESAGGYLASITATTNNHKEFDLGENLNETSEVQGAIDLYGLSDLTKVADDFSDRIKKVHKSPASPEAIFVNGVAVFDEGGSIESNIEKAKKANPITYISEFTPPFLLMHGDSDKLVSPSQTKILYDALTKNGTPAERYVVKGANHADEFWYQPEIIDIIIKFLNKNLKSHI